MFDNTKKPTPSASGITKNLTESEAEEEANRLGVALPTIPTPQGWWQTNYPIQHPIQQQPLTQEMMEEQLKQLNVPKWIVTPTVPPGTIYYMNPSQVQYSPGQVQVAKDIPGTAEMAVMKAHLEKWLDEEVIVNLIWGGIETNQKYSFFFKKSNRKAHVLISDYEKWGKTLYERLSVLLDRVRKHLNLPVVPGPHP